MKKVSAFIIALVLLFAPMTVFGEGVDFDEQFAELFKVHEGYEFQFYKKAEIYVDGERVYSKPNGAFSVKWNVMAQSSDSVGTLYATLYEKITVGTTEILKPLEIKVVSVLKMPTDSNVSYGRKPETNFENLNPDKAYIVKAVILDDTLNPCACSSTTGVGFNCKYFTFDLNDVGSYGDNDGTKG